MRGPLSPNDDVPFICFVHFYGIDLHPLRVVTPEVTFLSSDGTAQRKFMQIYGQNPIEKNRSIKESS